MYYIFEDNTKIDTEGYLDSDEIKEEESEHGRLILIFDGHKKVPCCYA